MSLLSLQAMSKNWASVALGDLLSDAEVFSDGDWVESKDQDPLGEVRLIQLADVGVGRFLDKSARFMTFDKALSLKCTFLKSGDVLVARMPDPLGRACIFPGDQKKSVTVVDVCVIRPNPDRVNNNWLAHAINSTEFRRQISYFVSGTTRQRISRGNIAKLVIQLPPLNEQKRIADIMDKADALRAKRRATLAQLDNLTQSIFLDAFGDPSTNPRKLPMCRIGDLLASASYGTSEKAGAEGEFPVLRMNNITPKGEIDLSDLKYMDLDEGSYDRYLVRKGDVLFNRTNSAELVGKAAIFREVQAVAYAGYLIRLRVNDENDPEYLSAFLNTAYAKKILRGMCKSIIGMANINAKEVQGIKIARPSLDEQREFARRVLAIDGIRKSVRAHLAQLDSLFMSLQQRAFNGRL